MTSASASQKWALRVDVRRMRSAMTGAERAAATDALAGRVVALARSTRARTVACYRAVGTEPDTGPFVTWALDAGRRVLLPVCLADGRLDWAEAGGPERPGLHGIPEPTGARLGSGALAHADLVLVPAAAVGDDGVRLGWGRGYFDRTLATLPPRGATRRPAVVAVVFDPEFGLAVPRDAHDEAVDGVVTPTRTVRTASAPASFS